MLLCKIFTFCFNIENSKDVKRQMQNAFQKIFIFSTQYAHWYYAFHKYLILLQRMLQALFPLKSLQFLAFGETSFYLSQFALDFSLKNYAYCKAIHALCNLLQIAPLMQTSNASIWVTKNLACAFLLFIHYPIHHLRMLNISFWICFEKFHY